MSSISRTLGELRFAYRVHDDTANGTRWLRYDN
jgi:hypothetical protein